MMSEFVETLYLGIKERNKKIMASKQDIKNLVNSLVNTMETIGSVAGIDASAGNAAKMDLLQFMMYLSASDGEIQWSEASMMSDLIGLNLTPQDIGAFIRENNVYSTEFENTVPISLQLMVQTENKLLEQNLLDSDTPSGPDLILSTFKAVAMAMIEADNDTDSNEISDCEIYIDTMEKYINNNSLRKKSSISGFTKNSGNVSAPTKSGVSAPKKG